MKGETPEHIGRTPVVSSAQEVDEVFTMKTEIERQEVVYRLGGIDPDEGIDIYEIVPLLQQFRDLVTETAMQMGCGDNISIKVRPFKEGSFITEFIVQGQRSLVDLFSSNEASALANALQFLGFLGVGVSIPMVVKKVKGRLSDCKENEDGTYTYGRGKDAVTVSAKEHDALQSPKIADLYGKVAVGPMVRFDGSVQQVNIYVRDREAEDDGLSQGATFTRENAAPFAEYSRSADLIDRLNSEENISTTHGLTLTPLSGPYDGSEKGYAFSDGENTYKRVAITDEKFRSRLETSEARLTKGDKLKVDLEVRQAMTRSGNISTRYRITRVIDYVPRNVPTQEMIAFEDDD